jgi:hypothetical protein
MGELAVDHPRRSVRRQVAPTIRSICSRFGGDAPHRDVRLREELLARIGGQRVGARGASVVEGHVRSTGIDTGPRRTEPVTGD